MENSLLSIVEGALKEVDFDSITTVQTKTCRSFDELISVYRQDLTVTDSLVDCMAVCAAVHLATKLDGDPLWLYLVGAPSSGKSTLCELIASDEFNSKSLSKFTGLVSGSNTGSHLVTRMNGKCVIIKDGTLLLESAPTQLSNVFGELRDIYDGSLEAHYRNGVEASFSGVAFSMIIGITEKVYGLDLAALGERFLHCRLETYRETELDRNQGAILRIFEGTQKTVEHGGETDSRQFPTQRQYTAGFLQHLHDQVLHHEVKRLTFTQEDAKLIQHLADVVACSRASVPKDGQDNILYDSSPEASTRVVKQISRLALCLAYVYNTECLDDTIRRLIRKVALDSAHSRQHSVIWALAQTDGMTRTGIANATNISIEQVRRIIDTLLSLGICEQSHVTMSTVVGLPDTTSSVLSLPEWIKTAFTGAYDGLDNAADKSDDAEASP